MARTQVFENIFQRYDNLTSLTTANKAFSDNNVFTLYLNLDIKGPEIDVPIICRQVFEKYVDLNYNTIDNLLKVGRISVLLPEVDFNSTRRTSNSIFKAFQDYNVLNYRRLKIRTNNNEVYYGGNGYILDKDFNILLLYTLNGIFGDGIFGNGKFTYKKGRIYVNPKVFLSKGIVEKGIVKNVIPFFAQNGIYMGSDYSRYISQEINIRKDGRLTLPLSEIVIADVTDRFIVKPKEPNIEQFDPQAINNHLLENLDDLTKLIGL